MLYKCGGCILAGCWPRLSLNTVVNQATHVCCHQAGKADYEEAPFANAHLPAAR